MVTGAMSKADFLGVYKAAMSPELCVALCVASRPMPACVCLLRSHASSTYVRTLASASCASFLVAFRVSEHARIFSPASQ